MEQKLLISELNLIKAEVKDLKTKSIIQDKRMGKIWQRIDELTTRLGFLEDNTNNL